MRRIRLSSKERKNIGARLKGEVGSQGWTWQKLERQLGVSRTAIENHESGINLPTTRTAHRYAQILDKPLEELFGIRLAAHYERIKKEIMRG